MNWTYKYFLDERQKIATLISLWCRLYLMTPGTWESVVDRLRKDNIHGAAYLAKQASGALASLPEVEDVAKLARALIGAQPAMAPIVNLANTLLYEYEKGVSTSKTAQHYREFLDYSFERVVALGEHRIRHGMNVLTLSYSSTVLEMLCTAHGKKHFNVVCCESRPAYEGLELASELASAGIDTTVVADAALVNELQHADIVLVGADAISSSGIVNKIGTRGVAIAAASYAIPVYVLCGSEKLVPIEYELKTRVERDPRELYDGEPLFNVKNYYFESTPLSYIDVIATESGWKRESDIRDMLRTHHLHTDLLT